MNLMSDCKPIQIGSLKLGTKIDFDILNAKGRVLLGCGSFVTRSIVQQWLSSGFSKVLIRSDATESEASLLRPYDPQLLERIALVFNEASAAIQSLAKHFDQESQTDAQLLDELQDRFLTQVNADRDAAICCAENCNSGEYQQRDEKISMRSVRLSAIGTATGIVMDLPFEQCQTICMAGLLHDISLISQQDVDKPENNGFDVLKLHPIASARILESMPTISEQTKTVISQVHEQCDGSGFPKGLSGSSLSVMSRILNIVDAYLTLVEPGGERTAFLPSDVMTYLIFHSKTGKFDRDCAAGFVKTMSVYPVGSRVELDDTNTATVLRSSLTDAICPIVRVDSGEQPIVDLRKSPRCIVRPLPEVSGKRKRLPKSKLSETLWVN